MKVEERLKEMGLELPAAPAPIANYVRYAQVGNLLFLAGHGPNRSGGPVYAGKLGADVSIEEGYEAARSTALNLLASTREALGDLDRVKRVVKVLGMVNSAPDFGDQRFLLVAVPGQLAQQRLRFLWQCAEVCLHEVEPFLVDLV